mmetsp:Transcript_66045/g.106549  ORF Transcript_66045/g.106549 Transcript_66045/m.106549 type:complete len:245 (+) Transcript_66045:392-1126(+)
MKSRLLHNHLKWDVRVISVFVIVDAESKRPNLIQGYVFCWVSLDGARVCIEIQLALADLFLAIVQLLPSDHRVQVQVRLVRLAIHAPHQCDRAEGRHAPVAQQLRHSADLVCLRVAPVVHHDAQGRRVVRVAHEVHQVARLLHVEVHVALGAACHHGKGHDLELLVGCQVRPQAAIGLGHEAHCPGGDRSPVIWPHQVWKFVLDHLKGSWIIDQLLKAILEGAIEIYRQFLQFGSHVVRCELII